MNTIINVRSKAINIDLKDHVIHIINNDSLISLLANDTEDATDELVLEIKKQH